MQLAEISEETWGSLSTYTLQDFFIPLTLSQNTSSQVQTELEEWDSETIETAQNPSNRAIKGLSINVNQICNLKCSYCYAGGDGTFGEPIKNISVEKTLPQLKFFIDRLQKGSEFSIKFVGGEPLLYTEGILAIAEYVKEYGAAKNIKSRFSIVTNGTQFTEKNINALKKINAFITVSLDGPPKIHDQFRKTKSGEGSAKAILEGLEKLMTHKEEFSGIQFSGVFGKHNINLVEAYKFYSEFPVEYFKFYIEFGENDPQFQKQFESQFSKVLNLAFEKGGEKELRRISIVDQYFSQLDQQYKITHHCGAGTRHLSVDAKNRVFPCPIMVTYADQELKINDNIEKSLENQFKSDLIEQNNCTNCWARFICGGGCMYVNHQVNKDFHKKSLSFCERTRFMIIETLSYYATIRGGQNSTKGDTHETY